jgi:hypothetical protein
MTDKAFEASDKLAEFFHRMPHRAPLEYKRTLTSQFERRNYPLGQ